MFAVSIPVEYAAPIIADMMTRGTTTMTIKVVKRERVYADLEGIDYIDASVRNSLPSSYTIKEHPACPSTSTSET